MIGNFELQNLLGRGGMGEVWKAWDKEGERLVVIKLVPLELQGAEEEMARVRETFQLVHALHHQHICPLYLLSKDPQFGWYLLMKFIDGQTLSDYRETYVARNGSFPVQQLVKVLRPVAEALDYAHRQKVIHRDIKPKNILVVGDAEDVQVVDFGLASEIRKMVSRRGRAPSNTSGTPTYMAPEQWKGEDQDAATDQYGLAATAYELLADHLPFHSGNFDILRDRVLNEPPQPIKGMADSVNRALLIGMGKRRQERFATCLEFIQAIEWAQASQPVRKVTPKTQVSTATPPDRIDSAKASPATVPPKQQRVKPPIRATEEPPKEITNSIGMKMVLIPSGEFWMGAEENEVGAKNVEKPLHLVKITQPFYLGVYPVTQGEFQQVIGQNPSKFQGDIRRPVEQVSWKHAVEFCRQLSAQEGMKYRLPTEAEWEYACRAGGTGRWCFGEDESQLKQYAWYGENFISGGSTHPVGQKKPNAWGLYDIHGNVWEWCADNYAGKYYQQFVNKVAVNPRGPSGSSYRVIRGGCWWRDTLDCRSAYRRGDDPGYCYDGLGFRLARSVAD